MPVNQFQVERLVAAQVAHGRHGQIDRCHHRWTGVLQGLVIPAAKAGDRVVVGAAVLGRLIDYEQFPRNGSVRAPDGQLQSRLCHLLLDARQVASVTAQELVYVFVVQPVVVLHARGSDCIADGSAHLVALSRSHLIDVDQRFGLGHGFAKILTVDGDVKRRVAGSVAVG